MSDAASTPSASPSGVARTPAGTVVDDRYEVLRFIGQGDMGQVYEAEDVRIERRVALKILDRQRVPGSCEFEQRFVREAQTAARFDHPNVVTIHDFGFFGDHRQPYLAMECLDGRDLGEVIADGRLEPARVIRLLTPCLGALAEAHAVGIVHQDLKPSNFFLTHPGTERESLLILDFGAAALARGGGPWSEAAEQPLETYQYLAPECVDDDTVGMPTFDIYQMALIFLECLTGQRPIDCDDRFLCLRAHWKAEYTVPTRLAESPLGRVLRRAAAVDPGERYPDAGAFHSALGQLDASALPQLDDADLSACTSLGTQTSDDAVTLAALERIRRMQAGDDATAPVESDPGETAPLSNPDDPSGIHALAAAGDERGILASMESIDRLEPEAAAASSARTIRVVVAVVVLAIVAVIAFVIVEMQSAADDVAETPSESVE